MDRKKEFKRLSKSIKPVNYKICLKPDLEKLTFEGHEEIQINIEKESSKIKLNSSNIEITSAVIYFANEEIKVDDIQYNEEKETVRLKFSQLLPITSARLTINFTGILNDKSRGFYRSKYKSLDGEDRYLAVTQFESSDARQAFPCWDEPSFKATFDITVIAPKDRIVLSNMDVREQHEDENLQTVIFNTTPVMSTYLVAFAVGEFDFIEEKLSNGVIARVYTPLGKKEQGSCALEITVKTIPLYEEYFKIKYPLPKIDLIAIPELGFGAMENWGLVTFRETCLLVDDKESSAFRKQMTSLTVGHELAHQWFGNLTTLKWWSDLWLNEGFASWIEYLCVDHCYPHYGIWTQFISIDYMRALQLDALSNSHPIEIPIGHPGEINEVFDAISYSKGSCIIRMLYDFIGATNFKNGLHNYLTEFQYGNATTSDLWYHLSKASQKPIEDIMGTWTKQVGYPVLSVDSDFVDGKCILKVSQQKFNADGSKDPLFQKWIVPINITFGNNTKHKTIMNDPDMYLFIENIPANTWVKFNSDQVGFYRISYSRKMLDLLISTIHLLNPIDRLGILSDQFALSVAGLSKTTDFLDVLKAYKNEEDDVVWKTIDSNISSLAVILQNTDYFQKFQNFVVQLYKPMADKLGWDQKENENERTAILRCLILQRLGESGDEDVLSECKKKFEDHHSKVQAIPADLRSAVYSAVVSHGDEEALEKLIELYRQTTHKEERGRILTCIGSFDRIETIKKALEFSFSDEVLPQETMYTMIGCTGTLIGRQTVWNFMKENWDEIYNRYRGGFLISRLIDRVTDKFATLEEADDIKMFFAARKVPSGERSIKQSLEKININHAWLQREKENLMKWFRNY